MGKNAHHPPDCMASIRSAVVDSRQIALRFTRLEMHIKSLDSIKKLLNESIQPKLVPVTDGVRIGVETSSNILVLDSSFNPPTIAHRILAVNSLKLLQDDIGPCYKVVLLYAIRNADKGTASCESDFHRINMMNSMPFDFNPTIAVTNAAKFVDKLRALDDHFGENYKFHFIMGVDTLVRFLDQKYYEDPIEQVKKRFFHKAGIICSDRADITRPLLSKDDELHVKWLKTDSDRNIAEFSSTKVREAFQHGRPDKANSMLDSSIFDYIKQNNLFAN